VSKYCFCDGRDGAVDGGCVAGGQGDATELLGRFNMRVRRGGAGKERVKRRSYQCRLLTASWINESSKASLILPMAFEIL
jgi:hypothetical protein